MPNRPFRFIHAGDFHLEQPLMGVAEVPDHLRDVFLDAPYLAAQRVFDAAIDEDAQFVVLSGDLLQPPNAGPRAILFLVEQFSRLAERNIPVYWAGGDVDPPEAWPSAIPMPGNVHRFPRGRVEQLGCDLDGMPLVRLAGASCEPQHGPRPGEFVADPGGLYTLAVAYGTADPSSMQGRGVHYWALGGRHDRSTPLHGPCMIHYCGSPQGRCPQESGIHGCTFVEVNAQQSSRTSLIPTEAARWHTERLPIDDATTHDDLELRIRERLHTLQESATDVPLMISWLLSGKGALAAELRRGRLAADLLNRLRVECGHGQPPAWSISLDLEWTESLPPEWYEQETIRGDFLRALRQLQMNPAEPVDLQRYVAESHRAGTLAEMLAIADEAVRQRALREATLLGVDLLSGEETQA